MEALEDQLAILGRDAGTAVADLDRRLLAVVRRDDPDRLARRRVAQRVVDEDAHDARDGAGVARRPARARRRLDEDLAVALARADLELRADRPAQLAELDGLRAHRHVGVEAAEVEQL